MKKLFKLTPKDHGNYHFDYYTEFLIAADTIPEALELMYKKVSPEQDAIPYYLRSSNIKIETIGNVELEKNVHQILMCGYYSGD